MIKLVSYDIVSSDDTVTETLSFSYEEIVEALEDYMRKHDELDENEYVVGADIPLPIQDDGLIDIDFEFATFSIEQRD